VTDPFGWNFAFDKATVLTFTSHNEAAQVSREEAFEEVSMLPICGENNADLPFSSVRHDFLDWKQDQGHREIKVMRRYHIQDRDDYAKYNRLCGSIHHLALRLSKLPSTDPFREKTEASLLGKCYDMALVDIGNKMSDLLSKVTVSSFARRRLGVVMVRLKMSETVKQVSINCRGTGVIHISRCDKFRRSHTLSKDRLE